MTQARSDVFDVCPNPTLPCNDPRCDAGCRINKGEPRFTSAATLGRMFGYRPRPGTPSYAPVRDLTSEERAILADSPGAGGEIVLEVRKPTNPKDRIGIRKAGMSCVPQVPLAELGVAMMEGGLKYGPFNWREAGVRSSVYFDAAMRHLRSWWEGEDVDPDSGLSHLVKAMACLAVLRDAQVHHMVEDDRPPTDVDIGAVLRGLDKIAADLIDRYRPETDQPQEDKT